VKAITEASRALSVLSKAPANIVWTAGARAASFLVPLLVARRYGAGPKTDAFFLAFGAVTFFVSVGGVVLEQSIVPHAASLKGSGPHAVEWLWRLIRSVGLLGIGLAATSLLTIQIAVRLQPRPELQALLTLGSSSGVAMIPMFAVVGSLAAGVLTGLGRYQTVCVGLLVRALVAVAIILVQPFRDPFPNLALAFLGAEAARTLFNTLACRRLLLGEQGHDRDSSAEPAPTPSMSRVWQTTWPVSLSMTAAAISPIVDRVIAAGIMLGGVSLIEYGEKAYFLVVGTVVAGLQVTALTQWSARQADAAKMWEDLRGVVKVLCGVAIIAVPALFLIGPMVARGIMGSRLAATVPSAGVLTGFYLVAIVPYTIGGLAIRALMARHRTRPLLVLGVVKLGANIVGDIAFASWIGIPGISLATVVAETLVAIGALHYARQELAPVPAR
jgi:putative peptidoglycan lipid II flippase